MVCDCDRKLSEVTSGKYRKRSIVLKEASTKYTESSKKRNLYRNLF